MLKLCRATILLLIIVLLPGMAFAAPKSAKKNSASKAAGSDLAWAKEYYAGVEGEAEKTTATGDTVTVDVVVPSKNTMYDLLNNIKGNSRPGSFSAGRSRIDANGEFNVKITTTLDSDRFENAADFNKLFNKMLVAMQYVFTCDKAAKVCEYNGDYYETVANNYFLDQLEGKPGEVESLGEKKIEIAPTANDLISIAIEGRGKLESLFAFRYGAGEFNAKGIAFLKKHFPLTPIIYKSRYHFSDETGWEPKEPVVAACGNYKGTVKIVGGGRHKHNYTIIPIDTTCVNGDALIKITATVGKSSAASFDVFKDTQKIPTTGSPASITSAHDVAPGRTKVLNITARHSKFLKLGSEVSWKSPAGVENTVDLDISVKYIP